MDRISESTFDTPVEYTTRQLGNRRASPRTGEALKPSSTLGFGEGRHGPQPPSKSTDLGGQNSHGAQWDPNASHGNLTERGTRIITSCGTARATGDRDDAARSPRSSLRSGKPATRRRGTVGSASQQEEGSMPAVVNTTAILDMQYKLYRWSRMQPDKV